MDANAASIPSSLPPPTLRDPVRRTKALPAIEVMAGGVVVNGMLPEVNSGHKRPISLVQAKKMGALVQLYINP